jgi:hypothetical protein
VNNHSYVKAYALLARSLDFVAQTDLVSMATLQNSIQIPINMLEYDLKVTMNSDDDPQDSSARFSIGWTDRCQAKLPTPPEYAANL